ncbi:MAG: hypothetical protein RL748_48, partial [Pseudomonadota bacterium]
KDKDFQYLLEDIEEFKKLQKDETVSLNEAVRRKEIETREARMKARQASTEDAAGVAAAKKNAKGRKGATPAVKRDDGLLAEERNLETELAAEKEQKNAKDVLLNEAARVMADEIDLQRRAGVRLVDKSATAPSSKAPLKATAR